MKCPHCKREGVANYYKHLQANEECARADGGLHGPPVDSVTVHYRGIANDNNDAHLPHEEMLSTNLKMPPVTRGGQDDDSSIESSTSSLSSKEVDLQVFDHVGQAANVHGIPEFNPDDDADEAEVASQDGSTATINSSLAAGILKAIQAPPGASVYNFDPTNHQVSNLSEGLLPRDSTFHFRLRLTKLVKDANPRPPNSFIDKLMDLLKESSAYSGGDLRFNAVHELQETFERKLRRVMGREILPVVQTVALESGSYLTMDQYDSRNAFRDTAAVVTWNAFDQVRSLFGNESIFGSADNLVVDHNDHFAKFSPADKRLGEVMTGTWYDGAYEAMIRRHASRTDLTEKFRPFLCPIMLGMDATGVDSYNRYKSEPLMMSFAVIREFLRNKTDMSWKPLGLLPPLDHKSKNARARERQGERLAKALKYGLNSRNYHKSLGLVLQSLRELQEKGMILELTIGDQTMKVHCYFPICNWLGDIKSQDMLSGRVMSHRFGCPRLCWQCACPFQEMDNANHVCVEFRSELYSQLTDGCERITVYDPTKDEFYAGEATKEQKALFLLHYRNMVDEDNPIDFPERRHDPDRPEAIMELDRFEKYADLLKSHGCLRVDSFIKHLDFGGSDYRQFGALSVDVLHSLLGGVIKQMNNCFIRGLPSVAKESLEEIADRIFLRQRNSERRYFPRMNFTHGCTNLTELTCCEWAGLSLTLLLACHTYSGERVIQGVVKKTNKVIKKINDRSLQVRRGLGDDDQLSDDGSEVMQNIAHGDILDDSEKEMSDISPADFVEVSESILAFYGYLSKREFWKKGNETSKVYFQQSCDILLGKLVRQCPRFVGNGWKIAKVHAMFKRASVHIDRFGSPRHVNTQLVERGLRGWVKKPAINTNRQSFAKVTKATAMNLDLSMLVDEVIAKAKFPSYVDDEPEFSGDFDSCEPLSEDEQRSQFPNLHTPQYVIRKPEWLSEKDYSLKLKGNPSYTLQKISLEDSTRCVVKGKWQKSKAQEHRVVPEIVLQQMNIHLPKDVEASFRPLECYTETFLKTGKRIRCHPNYLSKGPTFDYVLLKSDPFSGVNKLLTGFDGMEYFPLPDCWRDNRRHLDPPITVRDFYSRETGQTLFGRNGKMDEGSLELYDKIKWDPLTRSLEEIYGGDFPDQHALGFVENNCVDEVAYVSDLPCPSTKECLTEYQNRFGKKVVPAKILCLFRDPSTFRLMALVHPCRYRSVENYVRSSVFISNWTLQYRYSDASLMDKEIKFRKEKKSRSNATPKKARDRMTAITCIVDVENDILDRIAAWEEMPGTSNTLDPSSWNQSPEKFGMGKPRSGDPRALVSNDVHKNRTNRRRAADVHRSVMVLLPMEYWGNEFTKEGRNSGGSHDGSGARKRRKTY